jgi:hypothetical protein
VDIGPSRRLAAALLIAHLVAVAAIVAASLPLPVAMALMLAVTASGGHQVARVALVSLRGSIVCLQVEADGAAQVRYRDGRTASATVLDSTVTGGSLSLVRLRIAGDLFLRTVPLLADNCSAASFRRLRTGLAWQVGAVLRS